jgi:6-phosphogluconolactonase (cycloisomerase 2 family)
MHLTDTKIIYRALCLVSILLSACGGGGGGGATPGTTTVRSAYVANYGDSTISQYTIDATTGALTPIGTIASGANPSSVTVDPSVKFAYVANSGGYTISQYTIGAGGALAQIGTIPVDTGGLAPFSIAVAPSGNYAYSANSGSDDISQYTIGIGGALTLMTTATVTPCSPTPPPCAQGKWPNSLIVDSKSQYVYVTNLTSNTISQYTIGTGGALTPMTPQATVATGSSPVSVAVAGDSTGSKFVYVANNGSATVSQYSISNSGALSLIGTIAAGTLSIPSSLPTAVTVAGDTTGSKYVYVTNGSVVSQYTINPNGTLVAMTPNPTITAGSTSQSVSVDAKGKYAYVANLNGNNISQYDIGTGGALAAMTPQATVATGSQPYSVTTAVSIQ